MKKTKIVDKQKQKNKKKYLAHVLSSHALRLYNETDSVESEDDDDGKRQKKKINKIKAKPREKISKESAASDIMAMSSVIFIHKAPASKWVYEPVRMDVKHKMNKGTNT